MQKTLPAITAEIEADFRKNFLAEGVSSAHQFKPEVSGKLPQMFEDFIRAALLKVAEEMQTTAPKEKNGLNGEGLPFENSPEIYGNQRVNSYRKGFNAAVAEMDSNFKTFINQ